MAKSIILIHL